MSGFIPPKTDAEFQQRASEFTLIGAKQLRKSLNVIRKALITPIDQEIEFMEKVIEQKESV